MTTTKKRPAPWSPEENAACVALYFVMLDYATCDDKYNKAGLIRAAQHGTPPRGMTHAFVLAPFASKLVDRSKQSIEFKLMNCSAAHADIINDYIESFGEPTNRETMHGHGYRAMPNYQASLKDAMHRALERRARGADGPALADAG